MKTRIFMLILAMALFAGSVLIVHASEETYGLLSRGRIVFDNETPETSDDVIFDASDLYRLAAKCQ